jgi:hypothetical protein
MGTVMINNGISRNLINPALNFAIIFEGINPGINSGEDILKYVVCYGFIADPALDKAIEFIMVFLPDLFNVIRHVNFPLSLFF